MTIKKLNNKQLLELIKTDVEAFNDYREKYPDQKINFERANFERGNLEHANFKKANLERANFEHANLEGVNLERANISGINIDGANLEGVKIILTKEIIEAIKMAIL